MCVTNTTSRRPQPVSLSAHNISFSPSQLSQRLYGQGSIPSVTSKEIFQVPNACHIPEYLNTHSINITGPSVASFISSNASEKTRPKRRRKPQKPGLTAKNHERHFVVHNYHDHKNDDHDDSENDEVEEMRRRGGVTVPFPVKLHQVLDQVEADGFAHVVSWQVHGRCFIIHDPKEFVDHIMPRYFRQSKLTSFQRQLNLYGFCRLTRGADAGGYYHELFLRGKDFLCKKMSRTKVKGTKFKAASSPENEPDFYKMPPVISPTNSSDEEHSYPSYVNQGNYDSSNKLFDISEVMNVDSTASCDYDTPIPYYPNVAACAPVSEMNPQVQLPFLSEPIMNMYSFSADEADRILDEAVEELFMNEGINDESLDDFVHDWDPTYTSIFESRPTIEDDAQLSLLLEKLLEE